MGLIIEGDNVEEDMDDFYDNPHNLALPEDSESSDNESISSSGDLSFLGDHHFDTEGDVQNEMKYCRLQEQVYRQSFGLAALHDSVNFESFVALFAGVTPEDEVMCKLVSFRNKVSLTREAGNELLTMMGDMQPDIELPRDWRSVLRHVALKSKHLGATTLRRVVPWPQSWNMGAFNEGGCKPPAEIEIIARDPLELVAQALVDPTIQYIHCDDCVYEYTPQTLEDGTPCWSSIMSSEFAKHTQAAIRARHTEGILIPVVTYADGVSLGLRNKVSDLLAVQPLLTSIETKFEML